MTPEYITKDTLKETLINWSCDASYIEVETKWALEEIKNIPAADVVPVRHGRWIEEDDSCCGFHATDIVCSECNKISEFGKFSYCPNCGAKMDGE